MPGPFPHVEGVEHRHVEARGLRFHVAEAGAPDADPVLLLHGWPQHWYEWRHQIPTLARHYRVIAADLRGFGWSDAPPDGYDKENMATDVLALLDALGLDQVRLMGHDWGGWIGFLMCFRAPERFKRFLALSIPPPWASRNPLAFTGIWRFWYQAVIAAPGVGPRVVRNLPAFFRYVFRTPGHPDAFSEEELMSFIEPLRDPGQTNATVQLYRTFLLREFPAIGAGRYNGRRLTVPTLLLFGTNDFAISTNFLRGNPGQHADHLEVELMPDTGHFLVDERPELVTQKALEFFGAAM
jgi:pimeloyl-ACP methyl ester carboxylesterase